MKARRVPIAHPARPVDIDDRLALAGQRAAMARYFPPEAWANQDERLAMEVPAIEAFAREVVRTVDEKDPQTPIKPLPIDELQYLRIFIYLFVRERLLMVPKSRQILITWITFICILWRLMKYPYQKWALVPKKAQDGIAHIEDRIKNVLWNYLPRWLTSQYSVAAVKGTFHITHFRGQPWNSWLTVYPQGADQLRQFTHSGIFGDEVAFQRLFRQWWKAAVPTIGGRRGHAGQVVLVSSASKGSYFEELLGGELIEAVQYARGELGPFAGSYARPAA